LSPDSEKIIAETMMNLIQTATKKGVITDEETMLLDEFQQSLQYFGIELDNILQNGHINESDELRLNQLKEQIIENGFSLAQEIDGVSTDMLNLITSLIFTLKVPKSTV
jgi:hypothetical protein